MTTIGCKWLYKVKIDPNGLLEGHKTMLAHGNRQIFGIDYGETFVAKLITLRGKTSHGSFI